MKNQKHHIYFKECTQEFITLPINTPNCYYLGEFTFKELDNLHDLVESKPISYNDLLKHINNNSVSPVISKVDEIRKQAESFYRNKYPKVNELSFSDNLIIDIMTDFMYKHKVKFNKVDLDDVIPIMDKIDKCISDELEYSAGYTEEEMAKISDAVERIKDVADENWMLVRN